MPPQGSSPVGNRCHFGEREHRERTTAAGAEHSAGDRRCSAHRNVHPSRPSIAHYPMRSPYPPRRVGFPAQRPARTQSLSRLPASGGVGRRCAMDDEARGSARRSVPIARLEGAHAPLLATHSWCQAGRAPRGGMAMAASMRQPSRSSARTQGSGGTIARCSSALWHWPSACTPLWVAQLMDADGC
jgi:hypothetical protein